MYAWCGWFRHPMSFEGGYVNRTDPRWLIKRRYDAFRLRYRDWGFF